MNKILLTVLLLYSCTVLAYPEVVYKDFHLKANEVKAYCQFQPPKVGKLAYVNLSFKHKNSEHLVFFRVLVTQRECREHILDFKNFLKKSNFVTIREQVSNQEGTRGFFERIKNEKDCIGYYESDCIRE